MLGLKVSTSADLIQQVERGFSYRSLQTFAETSSLPVSQIAAILAIPERTLARRKSSGKLSWEESERLLRLSTFSRMRLHSSKAAPTPPCAG
jgi:putative toxin-antitoxin system antitoxin component (TIGR02293 family)